MSITLGSIQVGYLNNSGQFVQTAGIGTSDPIKPLQTSGATSAPSSISNVPSGQVVSAVPAVNFMPLTNTAGTQLTPTLGLGIVSGGIAGVAASDVTPEQKASLNNGNPINIVDSTVPPNLTPIYIGGAILFLFILIR